MPGDLDDVTVNFPGGGSHLSIDSVNVVPVSNSFTFVVHIAQASPSDPYFFMEFEHMIGDTATMYGITADIIKNDALMTLYGDNH
jgi:hypothetical protein